MLVHVIEETICSRLDFARHRPRIHQLAYQLIIEGRFAEGRIVIRSRDMAEFLLS